MWKKDENKMQRVSGKKMTDQVGAYAMIAILADINSGVMIVYILETESLKHIQKTSDLNQKLLVFSIF